MTVETGADCNGILADQQLFDCRESAVCQVSAAGIRQRNGHCFRCFYFKNGVNTFCHRQGYQSGTGSHGTVGREGCRSGFSGRSGDNQTMTEMPFVGLTITAMQQGAHRLCIEKIVSGRGFHQLCRDTDISHHQAAGMFSTRIEHVPQFGKGKRNGHMRPDRISQHPSGSAMNAGRNVNRNNRPTGCIHQINRLTIDAADIAVQTGAEQSVDNHVGLKHIFPVQGRQLSFVGTDNQCPRREVFPGLPPHHR